MRLLNTALLSTALLMSIPFAADKIEMVAAGAEVSASVVVDEVAQTRKAFEAYKTQNGRIILSFLKNNAKLDLASLGLSKTSTYQAIVEKLGDVLSDLAAIKIAQATSAESLAAETEANKRLLADKAAAEAALVAANERLAEVTAEKEAADGKLVAAEARVAALTGALAEATAAAEQAGRDAAGTIQRLTTELAEVTKARDDLTAQVAELGALKDKTEEAAKVKAAGVRALLAANAKSTRTVVAEAAAAVPADDLDELLANYGDLLTGVEDVGSPSSLRGDSLENASPLRPLDDTDSPAARRNLDHTLAAAGAASASPAASTPAASTPAAATAAKIAELQSELVKAQATVAKGTTWSGSPTGPGKSAKAPIKALWDQHQAYTTAKAEVDRLTAALAALGVDAAATAKKK